MKTGLFGQELTIAEQLKAATFVAHARIQTSPFSQALVDCQLPLESYVAQLRALFVIHEELERALDNCRDERVASVWRGDMRRLPRLQKDLEYFQPRMVADLKEAADAAQQVAGFIRTKSAEQPLNLLGYLYVLEGSTLGAVVLKPIFARAFLLVGQEGLSYLHSEVPAVHVRWGQYQQRMNALRLNKEESALVVHAAKEFFAYVETLFQVLYPFKPESRVFQATSINPDAGQYPVPKDPREVEAAVKAGDICWERFPYLKQRYGERGLRFTRSDAAWLTTLAGCDPSLIIGQVRWLNRVLAGRGMPSIVMQVQLEMLVDTLVDAIPERRSQYEKLLLASADLLKLRRQHLSDEALLTLSASFDSAVGPELAAKFPRMGELIVCAVIDDQAGIETVAENVRQWMTDAARFPSEWIRAVESTLAQARQQAHPAKSAPSEHV